MTSSPIELSIPGRGDVRLAHVVLDMNGTIAFDGAVLPGVREDLAELDLEVVLATADTHGTAQAVADDLGVTLHRLEPGDEDAQKAALVGAESVAIGNGRNDVSMLAAAAVGICVIGGEGAASAAIAAADVVVTDIRAALGLLRNPRRLLATLRR